jgi:Mg2+-importing ATPase
LTKLPQGNTLIVKGAFNEVLQICTHVQWSEQRLEPLENHRVELHTRYEAFSQLGFRTLAVAVKQLVS